jgi:hypothetical protein
VRPGGGAFGDVVTARGYGRPAVITLHPRAAPGALSYGWDTMGWWTS